MTGRLVVVSNRVAPLSGKQAASAGGLAVGVHAALAESGGLWFGWSGKPGRAAGPTGQRAAEYRAPSLTPWPI